MPDCSELLREWDSLWQRGQFCCPWLHFCLNSRLRNNFWFGVGCVIDHIWSLSSTQVNSTQSTRMLIDVHYYFLWSFGKPGIWFSVKNTKQLPFRKRKLFSAGKLWYLLTSDSSTSTCILHHNIYLYLHWLQPIWKCTRGRFYISILRHCARPPPLREPQQTRRRDTKESREDLNEMGNAKQETRQIMNDWLSKSVICQFSSFRRGFKYALQIQSMLFSVKGIINAFVIVQS